MTNIPYADETLPVVRGCSKVSPGCARCWAAVIDRRFNKAHKPWTPENAAENVTLHPELLDKPLHWRKPRTVAVCFMSDLFHEQVPDEFIWRVFKTMEEARQHTYLLLTKRAERMRTLLSQRASDIDRVWGRHMEPAPNIWLGVSAENQHWADERIPLLLDTPGKHWVSLEPLLGPIDLGTLVHHFPDSGAALDWVVVGGESGPGYRDMNPAWAWSLSDQCLAAGVPFYGKQRSATRPDERLPGSILGRRETPW